MSEAYSNEQAGKVPPTPLERAKAVDDKFDNPLEALENEPDLPDELHDPDTLTEGGADTTDVTGTFADTEKFIPVTRFALLAKLTREALWEAGEAKIAERFFHHLAAWRHITYSEKLMDLKEAYAPFSPDRDTVRTRSFDKNQMNAFRRRLVSNMTNLLEQANYRPITGEQLETIFSEESAYGLDLEVDLSEFEELLIYCRGATVEHRTRRSWRSAFLREEEYTVPIYQRLCLLIKLKSEETRLQELKADGCTAKQARRRLKKARRMMPKEVSPDFIYIKLFKNIPTPDLEMMFPNTTVKFRLRDKLFLGLTAGGGTLFSIFSAAGKVALILSSPIKAIGALIGLIGVGVRQIMKFFNQRNQYMMVLAQNLYFHSLADNRGVLTLLTDRAEEEDMKEDLLLYCVLAKEQVHPNELYKVKLAIEEFLKQEFDVVVDYDIHEALERLKDDELVTVKPDGKLHCISPAQGVTHIDRKWDAYLDHYNAEEHVTEEVG